MIGWLASIHFDKILAAFVGLVAFWYACEALRDMYKTNRLIKEGKLRRSTLIENANSIENDNEDCKVSFVIDDCYLSANSSPYVKIGGLRYE